jgi:hypothetical protein
MRRARKISILGLLVAAGCGETPPPPKLPDLADTHAITIESSWTGLSPVGRKKATYRLERHADEFRGSAQFEAGLHSSRKHVAESVTLPVPLAKQFLSELAAVPIRDEKPDDGARLFMTDHYPETRITLSITGTMVTFSSVSQERGGRPWKVVVADKAYVSDSETPSKAFDTIRAQLKWELYERLQEEVVALSRRDNQPR